MIRALLLGTLTALACAAVLVATSIGFGGWRVQ